MVAKTFHEFLSSPLHKRTRWVLIALVAPLLLSFLFPLWQIRMAAPQYPRGLYLDIYSYRIDAGNEGHDLTEINILNHYIGMQKITRDELRDLDWIPFALGGLALLALRVALIGNVRSLFDLAVLTSYVSLVSLGRFVYMLYEFGHDLDPKAPMDVEPFTPAIIGVKQIANFTTYSYPRLGSVLIGAFTVGVWAALALVLLGGRRAARLTGNTASA